jgi:NitT/TauT family transport system substrate-binding protein
MTMKRFATAMLGLGLLAASGAARAEQIVINQAGHSLTASSIYLAQDLGFFAKQGLDVQFITTGSGMKSIVPLVSGSAQFCACIVFHPLQANHAGAADTRMIAGITTGFATKIVLHKDVAARLHLVADMPLKDRVALLRGLKIGVTELSASTDQALRVVMMAYGLNPERDATIVSLGGLPNLLPALQNHQVDAVSGSPPVPEQLQEGTAVLLVDPIHEHVGLLDKALFMAIAADKPYLASHRDVAERVVRAVAEGQSFLHEQKEKARQVLKEKEFPNMPQAGFDAAFDAQYPSYLATPVISRESVDAEVKITAQFLPGFKGTYETLVDPSFAAAKSH